MKRYAILALALAMCGTLFTGCRRGPGMMETVSPTNEATAEMPTMPATMPATRPATEPATSAPTQPDTGSATEGTTPETQHRATESTESTEGARRSGGMNRPAMR